MNNEGFLFKKLEPSESHDLPLITGFNKEDLNKYPGYFRTRVMEVFNFLLSFQNHPSSEGYVVQNIHYHITEGISMNVGRQDKPLPMILFFGKENLAECLSKWDKLVKKMGGKEWFRKVDLQVKDKIFART